ncbi:hypothetical protein HZH66_009351 [Vespula vulgaris]|uniref:Uncharacterized protein n=2 Tax=Vespula TaxID=7451 RepID=A0A834U4U5_VESPE|nr:hypothetical protein HZH66_009351 [Vespula vulgaris]KAF7416701.1 hypothetical protein H0235_011232 [Vespula pensylvanica]
MCPVSPVGVRGVSGSCLELSDALSGCVRVAVAFVPKLKAFRHYTVGIGTTTRITYVTNILSTIPLEAARPTSLACSFRPPIMLAFLYGVSAIN